MDKGIGFNRNIRLTWLDAVAALCLETEDLREIRSRLQSIIQQEVSSPTNIRKTIDILVNIWLKSAETVPRLHSMGLNHFRETTTPTDRLWLHYGMTLMAYPFFYTVAAIIGQESRYEETITPSFIRQRIYAELGELGSVRDATRRVIYSLNDWSILIDGEKRNTYIPQRRVFNANDKNIETWLLACGLSAAPNEEMPVPDLLNLPSLYPFHFSINTRELRESSLFEISRQGMGMNMVRYVG